MGKRLNNTYYYSSLPTFKNSESRELPIATPLYLMLLSMEKISEFVFVRADGTPPIDIRGEYAGALKRANIKDFTFYD